VEARLHAAPVSQVSMNRDGIGLAFDTTPTVRARRARLITRVDGDGDYAAPSVVTCREHMMSCPSCL
jgi:hypothetical protein